MATQLLGGETSLPMLLVGDLREAFVAPERVLLRTLPTPPPLQSDTSAACADVKVLVFTTLKVRLSRVTLARRGMGTSYSG